MGRKHASRSLASPAVTQTLRFLVVLELLGLAGLPLAGRALGRLAGAGLGLARVLALLLLGWLVWLAGSLGVPNGLGLAIGAAVVLGGLALAVWRVGERLDADAFRRPTLIRAEILFVVAFLAGALFMAF